MCDFAVPKQENISLDDPGEPGEQRFVQQYSSRTKKRIVFINVFIFMQINNFTVKQTSMIARQESFY